MSGKPVAVIGRAYEVYVTYKSAEAKWRTADRVIVITSSAKRAAELIERQLADCSDVLISQVILRARDGLQCLIDPECGGGQ